MEKVTTEEIANLDEVQLASYLECPIDSMISMNPLMCKKCETIFCQDCIENWKKKSNVCPMRCNPIELIPIERTVMKQQLNKIKLACPNQKYGCLTLVPMNEVLRHEKVCDYRGTKCEKCLELVPLIGLNFHLYESCKKNQLPCIVCETPLSLKDILPHLEVCRVNASLCSTCIQNVNDFDLNAHMASCPLKIVECPLCKMPDTYSDIKLGMHKCLSDSRFKETNLNTYLKSIHSKYETNVNSALQKHDERLKDFNKKFNSLSSEIFKKESEKCLAMEMKFSKISDEQFKRLTNVKKDKIEIINKLKSEVDELTQSIEGKDQELLYLENDLEKNKSFLKKEYELKISSKKQNLAYLRNLLIQSNKIKPDQNMIVDSSNFNSVPNIVGSLFCKYCSTEVNDTITQKCANCSLPLCKNCAKQCPNKSFFHITNFYCNECFAECSLCLETKQCLTCTKKCFFKACNNYLCNTCFDKNKHQLRPENTNCKFYKCDNCQTDANCIMTTVYCARCDRRVCKNCFHKEHRAHLMK